MDINHWFNQTRKEMAQWLRRKYPGLHDEDREEVLQDAMVTLESLRRAGKPLDEISKMTPRVLSRRCCDHARKNVRYQDRHASLDLANRIPGQKHESLSFDIFEFTGIALTHEEIQFVTALHADDDPLKGLDLSSPQKRRAAGRLFWQIALKSEQ